MADAMPVFANSRMNTHMPFMNGDYLLFCGSQDVSQRETRNGGSVLRRMQIDPRFRANFGDIPTGSRTLRRVWKLFYCSRKDRQIQGMYTGLPTDYVECSPAMYMDAGVTYVSFIGGAPSERGYSYRLYMMSGKSLSSLSPAEQVSPAPTRIGFVNRKYICAAERAGIGITEKASGKHFALRVALAHISRVTFRADDIDMILITGMDASRSHKSLLYNLATKSTQEIKTPVPAYKSSVYGREIVTAVHAGEGIEPYHLRSSNYTLAEAKEKVVVV